VAAAGFEPTTEEKVNRNVALILRVKSEKNIDKIEEGLESGSTDCYGDVPFAVRLSMTWTWC
jgi:hypothetical protein